jgi:hypothetical protein
MDDRPQPNRAILAKYCIIVTGAAFLLHFAWEWLQCPLFFVHRQSPPTLLSMLVATAGDTVLTWIAQLAMALLWRRWFWALRPWSRYQTLSLVGCGVVLGVATEYWALATRRWAYTDLNPLIPGTGLSVLPVAQLAVLFPLTFWLTRRTLRV